MFCAFGPWALQKPLSPARLPHRSPGALVAEQRELSDGSVTVVLIAVSVETPEDVVIICREFRTLEGSQTRTPPPLFFGRG
jgi:hypothetical protein